MISAVQHAKRNALKSSSKITMVGFVVLWCCGWLALGLVEC